jgi:VIT1/CCC1 family predicted Fe2+/Mn2+ transporter
MIPHHEIHFSHRNGWLRAAVLGANDGIISVASLVVGIAASGASNQTLMMTALAGLVAGAISMAAGEYVSVKSQSDTEQADLEKEKIELHRNPEHELNELTGIYVKRGLQPDLARQVAIQLTENDALGAHARDEIGLSEEGANALEAALASAAAFSVGAIIPVMAVLLTPAHLAEIVVTLVTCIALFILGGLASYAGGASVWKGAFRVVIWGILAMACTKLLGMLFGAHLT